MMTIVVTDQSAESSAHGAARAAAMATLIATAKLNDVDPLVWLADVLAHIAATPQPRLHELLHGTSTPPRGCSKQPDRGVHQTVTAVRPPRARPECDGLLVCESRSLHCPSAS